MSSYLCVFVSLCLYVFMSSCFCVFMSLYLNVLMSLCLYAFVSLCLCVFMSLCLYGFMSFGLYVLRGRQVGSVVVLNTCLCVVLLSNARERGGGEESQITAKGVALHGKRSPD